LALLARADLVVLNGLGVEGALRDILRSTDRRGRDVIVLGDLVKGLESPRAIVDPHLWLNPPFARALVEAVGSWYSEHGHPEHQGDVEDVVGRIDAMDRAYRETLTPYAGARVVTDHHAWDRLLGRYGIEVVDVIHEVEGVEASPGRIAQVVEKIHDSGVRALLVEVQFSGGVSDQIVRATGVRVGRLDLIGSGDWFAMMEHNLATLRRVLGDGGGDGGG